MMASGHQRLWATSKFSANMAAVGPTSKFSANMDAVGPYRTLHPAMADPD